MPCRCNEIKQCRSDLGKVNSAAAKAASMGTANAPVQFQMDKIKTSAAVAYESNRRYLIGMKIQKKKTTFQTKLNTINEKMQAKRTELINKIYWMEREDEQHHIEEARRKREEEQRRKAEEAAKKRGNKECTR